MLKFLSLMIVVYSQSVSPHFHDYVFLVTGLNSSTISLTGATAPFSTALLAATLDFTLFHGWLFWRLTLLS